MNEKSGLYFHIPFCKNKCPYCDFYSVKYEFKAAEEYTKRLIEEIKKYCEIFKDRYGVYPNMLTSNRITHGRFEDAFDDYFLLNCKTWEGRWD